METKYWYLQNHTLFDQLSQQEIAELNIISCFKTANKSEYVYLGGRDLARLYILKKGRVKIAFQSESGEEVVMEILKDGDIFGAVGLEVQPNHHQEYAQALTDVALCSFTIPDFVSVMQKNPELAIRYSKKLGEKVNTVQGKFANIIFKDSRERIVNFFRLNALHEGNQQADGSYLLDMYLTHQDIAHFTAVSRQTVTTIINQLIVQQLIVYVGRRKVVIPNLNKLG